MNNTLIASCFVTIHAPVEVVWDALVNPEKIKKYLFGTSVTSSWIEGSPITYEGEWNGKPYKDKGVILKIVAGKELVSTYWSSMSGLADIPENYKTVSYILTQEDTATKLTITQDSNATQEDKIHSEQQWAMVLTSLKELLES